MAHNREGGGDLQFANWVHSLVESLCALFVSGWGVDEFQWPDRGILLVKLVVVVCAAKAGLQQCMMWPSGEVITAGPGSQTQPFSASLLPRGSSSESQD